MVKLQNINITLTFVWVWVTYYWYEHNSFELFDTLGWKGRGHETGYTKVVRVETEDGAQHRMSIYCFQKN